MTTEQIKRAQHEPNPPKWNRISGGAAPETPTCPTCVHLHHDKQFPGWGWCGHQQNRVFSKGWVEGFTPSQSPSGSCELHPQRQATENAS